MSDIIRLTTPQSNDCFYIGERLTMLRHRYLIFNSRAIWNFLDLFAQRRALMLKSFAA